MLKKIILLFFILFLNLPAVFADGDSSIIPVLWLFKQANKSANTIYEFKGRHPSNLDTYDAVKTFYLL